MARPSEDGPHAAKRKRPGPVRREEEEFAQLLHDQAVQDLRRRELEDRYRRYREAREAGQDGS